MKMSGDTQELSEIWVNGEREQIRKDDQRGNLLASRR